MENQYQYEREPLFKRIYTEVKDWIVTRALRIKDRVVAYFTSKDTWKLWKRRFIVIGVIILIALSFRVKEFFDLYPYDESSYLTVAPDRMTVTNYAGSTDFSRLLKFKENLDMGQEDSIRMVSSVNGYTVVEDLKVEKVNGTLRITLTTDNTKNKMLDKDKRVKTVEEFEALNVGLEAGVRIYKLVGGNDDREYVLAKHVLYN